MKIKFGLFPQCASYDGPYLEDFCGVYDTLDEAKQAWNEHENGPVKHKFANYSAEIMTSTFKVVSVYCEDKKVPGWNDDQAALAFIRNKEKIEGASL